MQVVQGEKEPETKEAKVEEYEDAVVDGLPVGPASTVLGAPVARSPWSTGLFSCFGNCGEHFTSDLQVCEYTSPCSSIYLFRFSVTWIISLEEYEVVHVYMG